MLNEAVQQFLAPAGAQGQFQRGAACKQVQPCFAHSAQDAGDVAAKFAGQLIGVAPSLDELDHLLPKLRRVRRLGGMRFGPLGLLLVEQ